MQSKVLSSCTRKAGNLLHTIEIKCSLCMLYSAQPSAFGAGTVAVVISSRFLGDFQALHYLPKWQ